MKRFHRPYLNIVSNWKIIYAISSIIFIVAIIALFTRGLNFGIDFTGGTELTVKANSGATISKVRSTTGKLGYADAQIQSTGGNTFVIRVPELKDQQKTKLIDGLAKDVGVQKDKSGNYIVNVNDVGPGWGAQVSRQAIIGLAIFLVAVIIYISLRFEFKMAMTAIIEIVHDFVITIGIYALLGFEVTPATVIAVLTILGYSLYDTIVIFDRIKENSDQLTRQSRKSYSDTVNDSVNEVLVRSINTSLVTLVPIVSILLFGGATLKEFALPLFIGILSGTYSSIILAPPILAQWKETEPKYRAYRDRADRSATARAASATGTGAKRIAAKGATPNQQSKPAAVKQKAASGQGKGAKAPAQKTQQGARPKPKPVNAPKVAGAEGGAQKEGVVAGGEAPKPKQKPPAPKAAQPTSKNLAKSRTKGPGSGKKKKKKK